MVTNVGVSRKNIVSDGEYVCGEDDFETPGKKKRNKKKNKGGKMRAASHTGAGVLVLERSRDIQPKRSLRKGAMVLDGVGSIGVLGIAVSRGSRSKLFR